MRIGITVLALALVLVNCEQQCGPQYCDVLLQDFRERCGPSMVTLRSCCDLRMPPLNDSQSGVYRIKNGKFDTTEVYCDMTTSDGGWIVIQRNNDDGVMSFNRNWTEYEEGFGELTGDKFWFGLKTMHALTQNGLWEMRLDYLTTSNTTLFLHYTQFSIGGAADNYPLIIGGYMGTAQDVFITGGHNGTAFSTFDHDNDNWSGGNCAQTFSSGWWHDFCYHININQQPPTILGRVRMTEIKIRPKNCLAF